MKLWVKKNLIHYLSLFASTYYFKWLDRNCQIFHQQKPMTAQVISQHALNSTYTSGMILPQTMPLPCPLTQPPPNTIVITVDGSYMENNAGSMAGAVAVFFKNLRNISFAGAKKVQCSSSIEAELKANQLGLQIERDIGFANVLLLSDSLAGVNELNNEGNYLHWSLRWQINLLKIIAASFDYFRFVFSPRSFITTAHTLATHARNGYFYILDSATLDDYLCNRFDSDTGMKIDIPTV